MSHKYLNIAIFTKFNIDFEDLNKKIFNFVAEY